MIIVLLGNWRATNKKLFLGFVLLKINLELINILFLSKFFFLCGIIPSELDHHPRRLSLADYLVSVFIKMHTSLLILHQWLHWFFALLSKSFGLGKCFWGIF